MPPVTLDSAKPLLLGVVAKEPVYAPELRERAPITDSLICARCDGTMVLTPDAIGRLRKRCPKCDGVAKVRHHPDQVLVPQTLVPVTLARLTAAALPPIEPGQLRCQRCAKAVDGLARFHDACRRDHQRELQRAQRSERAVGRTRTCLNCGATSPHVAGHYVTKDCSVCRPKGTNTKRAYRPKMCRRGDCGTVFVPTGPRALFCEAHR
jgi:hypothetical protein